MLTCSRVLSRQVPFLVWGEAQPAQNATISRTVVVAPPCDMGQYTCPCLTGDSTGVLCSSIPCNLLLSLAAEQRGPVLAFVAAGAPPAPAASASKTLPPPPQGSRHPPPPPGIQQILVAEQTVVMSYGQPPQQSLLPCASAAEAASGSCRAVAYDAAVSRGLGQQLPACQPLLRYCCCISRQTRVS